MSACRRASFIDPRYKSLQYEEPSAREAIRANAREMLHDLALLDDESETGTTDTTATAFDILFDAEPYIRDLSAQFEAYLRTSARTQPGRTKVVERPRVQISPRGRAYEKYMCIPASSASSECVFSMTGNIITAKRSLLLPENVSTLVFLYQNRAHLCI